MKSEKKLLKLDTESKEDSKRKIYFPLNPKLNENRKESSFETIYYLVYIFLFFVYFINLESNILNYL